MKILLCRHGQTDSNKAQRSQGHADIPLNDTGRKQAEAIAVALRQEQITAIYSSPLQRAIDTAKPLADVTGLEIINDPDLIEMDQGELEGLTGPEMLAKHPEFLAVWRSGDPGSVPIPGGESLLQVQQRMRRALARVIDAAHGDAVAVFSHNLAIRTYLCAVESRPLKDFRTFTVDPGCYNVLDVTAGGCRIEQVNCLSVASH